MKLAHDFGQTYISGFDQKLNSYQYHSFFQTLPEFLEIVKSNSRKVSSGSEILEGFKIYDQMMSREKDNGKISVKELRQVMTTFGEKLNSDEVDGMVTFADDCTFNGNIDYTSFVDKMMNPNKHRKKPAI